MDAAQRYCTGCARTLDEIACWGEMTDAGRARVIVQLQARRATVAKFTAPPLAQSN